MINLPSQEALSKSNLFRSNFRGRILHRDSSQRSKKVRKLSFEQKRCLWQSNLFDFRDSISISFDSATKCLRRRPVFLDRPQENLESFWCSIRDKKCSKVLRSKSLDKGWPSEAPSFRILKFKIILILIIMHLYRVLHSFKFLWVRDSEYTKGILLLKDSIEIRNI